MGSIDGNSTHELRMTEPAFGANGFTPQAGRPLDPSSIGKLVEQEVETLLGAAAAEADRISSTAMAVVRKAEAKIAALQLDLDAAVAELRELAERTEATTAPDEPPLATEMPVPGPHAAAETLPDEPASTVDPRPALGLPAVLTEPPAAMQRLTNPDRSELDMPASDDVVRLLREKLS